MAQRFDWKWNPTPAQRELFNEWKIYTVGYLVSCREGVSTRSLPGYLEDQTGENIPLIKMGFRNINQFLYEMQESIEVRTLNGKLFIFMREYAVPEHLMDLRKLVLGQAKDKGCKTKTGIIKRPTKNQSSYARVEELLSSNYANYRPASASVPSLYPSRRPGGPSNFYSRPNNSSGNMVPRNPLPPRYSRSNATNYQSQSSYSTGTSKPAFQYQQKPAAVMRPSASVNGKENYNRSSSSRPAATPQCQVNRIPRVPQGLILTDSDIDDSDSDGFDYCGGPVKSSTSTIKSQADKQVSNNTYETLKVTASNTSTSNCPAALTNPIVRRVASSSAVNMHNPPVTIRTSTVTTPLVQPPRSSNLETLPKPPVAAPPMPRPVAAPPLPKPVEPLLAKSPLPKSETTLRPTSFSKLPSESKPIQKNEALTLNGLGAASPRKGSMVPTVGLTLDTDHVLVETLPLRREPAVRMILDLPKIRFPQFLRGGSMQANFGLKAYLATM